MITFDLTLVTQLSAMTFNDHQPTVTVNESI